MFNHLEKFIYGSADFLAKHPLLVLAGMVGGVAGVAGCTGNSNTHEMNIDNQIITVRDLNPDSITVLRSCDNGFVCYYMSSPVTSAYNDQSFCTEKKEIVEKYCGPLANQTK